MVLKKVSTVNYDEKDYNLVICSNGCGHNYFVFFITHKDTGKQHLHIRCVFCDITFCPEME